jgi:NADH-quinone oxidoreductase subunit L
LYAGALLGAVLTAFYMFRLLFLTFNGSFRGTDEQKHHLHESPAAMTVPLVILAILSIIGGFVGIPEIFKAGGDKLRAFLAPVLSSEKSAHALSHSTELMLMGLAIVLVIAAVIFAFIKTKKVDTGAATGLGKVLQNKWYVDELYDSIIVKPLQKLSGFFSSAIEKRGIDGFVNGIGKSIHYGSRQIRLLQNGNVGNYILMMVIGVIVFLIVQLFI